MSIERLLLIPTQADPDDLLRLGPCRSRPPKVVEVEVDAMVDGYIGRKPYWTERPGRGTKQLRKALPLIWRGSVVGWSCDLLARALNSHNKGRRLQVYTEQDALALFEEYVNTFQADGVTGVIENKED